MIMWTPEITSLVVLTRCPYHCVHGHSPEPVVSVPVEKRPLLHPVLAFPDCTERIDKDSTNSVSAIAPVPSQELVVTPGKPGRQHVEVAAPPS